jgi:hypothetical protein
MKKKLLLDAVIVVVCLCGAAVLAQEKTGELHGVVDVTYLSKNVWRGLDVFNDKSGIQPSVTFDLWGTGLGFQVHSSRANSDGFENAEWLRYYLFYDNVLWADQPCQTNYRFGYFYYNLPDNPDEDFDAQELHMVLAWPKLLPVKGLVPAYVLVKMWPAHSDSLIGSRSRMMYPPGGGDTASGFAHIFMLDYGLEATCPITNQPRVFNLHSEVVFNDGVGPQGQNIDQDWSNAVFGISTDFEVAQNVVFTPGVYYQITMDKSCVMPGGDWDKDELWTTLSMKFKF